MKEITIDGIGYDCTPRLKPDESIFKAGDWVVYPDSKTVTQIEKNSILDEMQNSRFKLWKPTKGAWVCYETGDTNYRVVRYHTGIDFKVLPLEFISTLKGK